MGEEVYDKVVTEKKKNGIFYVIDFGDGKCLC